MIIYNNCLGIRSVLATRLSKSLSAEKAEETKLKKEVVSADVRSNQIKTKDVELTKKKQCNSNTKETKNEENENVAGADLSKTKASGCTTAKNTTKIGKGGEKENGNDAGDDSEEWSELIDFEMSDIVILDEYDSSKNPEVSTVQNNIICIKRSKVICSGTSVLPLLCTSDILYNG